MTEVCNFYRFVADKSFHTLCSVGVSDANWRFAVEGGYAADHAQMAATVERGQAKGSRTATLA